MLRRVINRSSVWSPASRVQIRCFAFCFLSFAFCLSCKRGTTLAAELGGWPHLVSTAWAGLHELGPAFLTEFRPLRILKSTVWAAHAASLLLLPTLGQEKRPHLLNDLVLRLASAYSKDILGI